MSLYPTAPNAGLGNPTDAGSRRRMAPYRTAFRALRQARARRADRSIASRLLDSRLQVHDSRIYVLNGLVAMTARNLGG